MQHLRYKRNIGVNGLPQATLIVFLNIPSPIEKVDTNRLPAALHSFLG
jgi:hypothetical protein